jgi:hypothetical protein
MSNSARGACGVDAGARHRPYCLKGAGPPSFPPPLRGDGAPQGASNQRPPPFADAARPFRRAHALRRSIAALFPVAYGYRLRAALAYLRFRASRSASSSRTARSGRRAGPRSSPSARLRAPPAGAASRSILTTSHENALGERGDRNISLIAGPVKPRAQTSLPGLMVRARQAILPTLILRSGQAARLEG